MKKSTIIALIITIIVAFNGITQDAYEMYASYQGMVNDNYLFTDDDDTSIEFTSCTEEVLADFDLEGDKLINHFFLITYIFLNEESDLIQVVKLEEMDLDN